MDLREKLDHAAEETCVDNTGCEACEEGLQDVECGAYPDCEAGANYDLLERGARIALESLPCRDMVEFGKSCPADVPCDRCALLASLDGKVSR